MSSPPPAIIKFVVSGRPVKYRNDEERRLAMNAANQRCRERKREIKRALAKAQMIEDMAKWAPEDKIVLLGKLLKT
jgi:hypothetical protein